MQAIKNIIFDLGGVLLDIDYNRTTKAFQSLGYPNFERMYSQFIADELFTKLETGRISKENFYEVLVKAHSSEIPEEKIAAAWNSMLLGWRKKSLEFLKPLSAKYQLYLLSNTNEIHKELFLQMLEDETGMKTIDGFFTKAYYSHKINLRKPGKEIFEFVLQDAGIKPEETLFIDDSENNIETAALMGFNTHLLLPGEIIEGLKY